MSTGRQIDEPARHGGPATDGALKAAVRALMEVLGIPSIRSGKVTLNFDAEGSLAAVEEFRHHKVLTRPTQEAQDRRVMK